MDKRIGWNLDSAEHATFNWIRPIPTCAKAGSRIDPPSTAVLDKARIISGPTLRMHEFKRRFVFRAALVLFIPFFAAALGPEPPPRHPISSADMVRSVTLRRDALLAV